MTLNGSFTICAVGVFNSAADTRCRTLDGCFSRAGVAVNSTMQEGSTFPSVEKERSVRALCASSTITIGRRNRSMFTSEGLGLPSAPGMRSARRPAGTLSKCSANAPF